MTFKILINIFSINFWEIKLKGLVTRFTSGTYVWSYGQ